VAVYSFIKPYTAGNGGGGKKRKKYVVHEGYNMDGFFEAEKNKRTTQV